jgi:RNA polymerase sigma-70 factor (ECF subfamily)
MGSRNEDFERLMLPHLDAAYDLARWLSADATLAQDIVQDAVLRALGHLDAYRGGDARAWLLRIVRNAAYDALASRRRRRTTSLDDAAGDADGDAVARELPDPADTPESAMSRCQDLRRLDQALAALPPDLRECLVLRELEELSYKEIAYVTGVPVGTVMSRLWRARRSLMPASDRSAEGAAP